MSTVEEIALSISEYIATTEQLKQYKKQIQDYRRQMMMQMEPLQRRLDELDKTIRDYLADKDIRGVRKGKNVCFLTKKPLTLQQDEKIQKVIQSNLNTEPTQLYEKLVRAMKTRLYKDDEFKEILCIKTEK